MFIFIQLFTAKTIFIVLNEGTKKALNPFIYTLKLFVLFF